MRTAEPLQRARRFLQAGAVAEAWHSVRCALALEPASSTGLTLAGQVAVRGAASDSALRYFTQAVQASVGDDHRVLLNLARAQQLAGRVQPAIVTARRAVELLPDDAQTRGFLVLLLLAAGHTAEGVAALRPGDDERIDGKLAVRIARHLKAEAGFRGRAIRLLERASRTPGDHLADALADLSTILEPADPRRFGAARRAILLSPAAAAAIDAVADAFAAKGRNKHQASWLWRSCMLHPGDLPRLGRAAKLTYEAGLDRRGIGANLELLKHRPGNFGLVDRLCQLHIRVKDRRRALAFGHDLLATEPGDPRIWDAVAGMFKSVDAIDEARALWPGILRRFPQYHALYYNYSLLLDEQNDLEAAAAQARAAMVLKPDYVFASNHMSVVQHRRHRLNLALRYIGWTLTVDPRYANGHLNKGNFLRAAGIYGRALDCFKQAEACAADRPATAASSRYNAGMTKIGIGELQDGFRLIESRWATVEFPSPKRPFRQAIWPGPQAAPGSPLLLYMEQGLGDEIMMSWHLPLVRRDVGRLVVDCDHRLIDLFTRSYEGVEFVQATSKGHPRTHESDLRYKIPAFHVPQYYVAEIKRLIRENWDWARRGGTRFPSRFTLAPERLERWRRWLDERFPGQPRIAVSWRSRVRNRDRDRQYLTVEQMASVIPPGAVAVNLQYSSTEDEVAEFQEIGRRRGFLVVNPDGVDLTDDLEDVLAILQEADAAVTPLISLAWMAGAVGCPAFIFRTSPERLLWHQMGAPFLPWAPSLKLFFRHPSEPWEPTVADVRHALSAYIRAQRPSP